MLAIKQIHNRKNKLIFSRWSRKSWAVFCSIGSEVKIAVLKSIVANGFIKKNKEGIIVPEIFLNEDKNSDESSGNFLINPFNPLNLLANLLQPQKNVVCGGVSIFNSENILCNNKSHPFLFGKDFLFFIPENLKIKKLIKEVVMLSPEPVEGSKHDISIKIHTSRTSV